MKNKLSIEDFRTLVRALQAAYTRESFIPNEYTFNLWYTTLQDIPYPSLNKACQNYIMTNKFPPTIADIRQLAYDMSAQPEELSSQAWNQLLRALREAYAPNSEQVWEQLPEITKNIVGGYATFRAWGNTELSALESVQRPMFLKRYEEMQYRVRREAAIPEPIRKPLPSLTSSEHTAIEYKSEEQPKEPAKPSGRSKADDLAELRKRLYSK